MSARAEAGATSNETFKPPPLSAIVFDRNIMRRSAIVALIVGTILNLIAQGDFMFDGQPLNIWKIALTYCVPYCVATYGAVTARLETYRRQAAAAGKERT